MPDYVKKIFSARLRLPKAKRVGFQIWRLNLVTETNCRIYFYFGGDNLDADFRYRSYHLFSKKTADGKRREKEDENENLSC